MSEVMLRRKLSMENTALRNLMIDVRMSSALALLQSTDWPISAIAQHVGYESASRFAERFRKRFGFAPTAIRGHQRIMEPGPWGRSNSRRRNINKRATKWLYLAQVLTVVTTLR